MINLLLVSATSATQVVTVRFANRRPATVGPGHIRSQDSELKNLQEGAAEGVTVRVVTVLQLHFRLDDATAMLARVK